MTVYLKATASCSDCGFATRDLPLLAAHSCDVQMQGGVCEDFPCCGHEYGDCNGQRYGSDESIRELVSEHLYCDHEVGIYECDTYECDDEDCAVTGTCTC